LQTQAADLNDSFNHQEAQLTYFQVIKFVTNTKRVNTGGRLFLPLKRPAKSTQGTARACQAHVLTYEIWKNHGEDGVEVFAVGDADHIDVLSLSTFRRFRHCLQTYTVHHETPTWMCILIRQ
jgi:hypothetical protein